MAVQRLNVFSQPRVRFFKGRQIQAQPAAGLSVTASGVTKDSTGAVLDSCKVYVFRDGSNEYVGQTVSDGSGNWSLVIPGSQPLFARAVDSSGTVCGTTLAFTSG